MKKLFFLLSVSVILLVLSLGMSETNNPLYGQEPDKFKHVDDDEGGGGESCEMSQECTGNICSVLHAKKRLMNGCKKKCNYTCTVQGIPKIF